MMTTKTLLSKALPGDLKAAWEPAPQLLPERGMAPVITNQDGSGLDCPLIKPLSPQTGTDAWRNQADGVFE
jgi:hypothetical protein